MARPRCTVHVVRHGKRRANRTAMIPAALEGSLRARPAVAHDLWSAGRANQQVGVMLPHALGCKF